jgi:hypothetical protein
VHLSGDAEGLFWGDWVLELKSLADAADPKRGYEYDAGQMEVVLKLGLLCSNTEPKARLGIRQVCRILEGEAPFPNVHMDSFSVNGCAAIADPEYRLLQEIQSGNWSNGNGWLSSTSLTSPR